MPNSGIMGVSSFRSTEIVALAQLVLTREFHGPVRTATAQELLQHARLALGRGEAAFAADLASLAAKMMAPGNRSGELAGELMQDGGGALSDPATEAGTRPPALPGLEVLELRERGVVLEPPAQPPRAIPPRLASEWKPRGIPRT
ncbi:MAG: hypothetical protein FJZ01_02720 [Candidatus Sericytochromatia bacterium]|nr:hypothetical protein [Candidatus Tanganyikabacteria bacterium]